MSDIIDALNRIEKGQAATVKELQLMTAAIRSMNADFEQLLKKLEA